LNILYGRKKQERSLRHNYDAKCSPNQRELAHAGPRDAMAALAWDAAFARKKRDGMLHLLTRREADPPS
jgi:hypothetical protein